MDLQGWDVVTASNVAAVNKVLAGSTSTTLPTFSFENTSLAIAMSGDFGPWTIQPGGSANRINLMVPITSGTLTAPQFRAPIDLAARDDGSGRADATRARHAPSTSAALV